MEKKYKLTEENINYLGRTLYRIEALKDFGNVKKYDKGGYVQSEKNLSQRGNCWIYDNAKVYDSAKVFNNAEICINAKVSGEAQVYNNALVCDKALIWRNAEICGNAMVGDNSEVYDDVKVYGNAKILGNSIIYGNALISGNTKIYGNVEIKGDAKVKNNSDYIVFKNWWSSGRYFTWTKSNNMWKVGCFYGTGKELIEKAYKDSELSGREYKRVVNYVESILKDNR